MQIFKKNATKAGKSALTLLRNTNNLIHLFGEKVGKLIAKEWSPCCGLCRRDVYFVDEDKQPTNITYPYTSPISGETYNDSIELGQFLSEFLGSQYIVYVYQTGNFVILGSEQTRKDGCSESILTADGLGDDSPFGQDEEGQITFDITQIVP